MVITGPVITSKIVNTVKMTGIKNMMYWESQFLYVITVAIPQVANPTMASVITEFVRRP